MTIKQNSSLTNHVTTVMLKTIRAALTSKLPIKPSISATLTLVVMINHIQPSSLPMIKPFIHHPLVQHSPPKLPVIQPSVQPSVSAWQRFKDHPMFTSQPSC